MPPQQQQQVAACHDQDGKQVGTLRMHAPARRWPSLTAQRLWFKHRLSPETDCEREHVRRASMVLTTSQYASERLRQLHGISVPASIVPELIDLASWRELFRRHAVAEDPSSFVVLCVCRFYPRKRVQLLVGAAARLRGRIPGLEVRIVGRGPEESRLHRLAERLRLGDTLRWLGDISQADLAAEYNRADLFCLPSVQEGFGIVFLEARAAGKPIVAARASAVPEVVTQGLLVDPDNEEELAAAIENLYRDADLRRRLADQERARVGQSDAPRAAARFAEVVRCAIARIRRSVVVSRG